TTKTHVGSHPEAEFLRTSRLHSASRPASGSPGSFLGGCAGILCTLRSTRRGAHQAERGYISERRCADSPEAVRRLSRARHVGARAGPPTSRPPIRASDP